MDARAAAVHLALWLSSIANAQVEKLSVIDAGPSRCDCSGWLSELESGKRAVIGVSASDTSRSGEGVAELVQGDV